MRSFAVAFVLAAICICAAPPLALADATSPTSSSAGVTIGAPSSNAAPASDAGSVTSPNPASDASAPTSPATASNAATPKSPAKTPSASAAGKTAPANASYEQRMNSCSADWSGAAASDRGTMTYRQFTSKCISGKTALPSDSTATCRDGSQASGAAAGGACAENGGVAAWQK